MVKRSHRTARGRHEADEEEQHDETEDQHEGEEQQEQGEQEVAEQEPAVEAHPDPQADADEAPAAPARRKLSDDQQVHEAGKRRAPPPQELDYDDEDDVVTPEEEEELAKPSIEQVTQLPEGAKPPDVEAEKDKDTVMMMFPRAVNVQHAGLMYRFPAGIHPVPVTIANMKVKVRKGVQLITKTVMHPYLRDNGVKRFRQK